MKILVISVHPDDETLGCGGTILKHKNQNDDVFWLILTNVSEELGYSKEFISNRANQIKEISYEYQFNEVYNLGFPTTKLHVVSLKFTAFWDYVRNGDPIIMNILRHGAPIIDQNFFTPIQYLLQQGRIRPSMEAVYSYYERSPRTLYNSRWHVIQATLDLYWAVVDSAHAALMKMEVTPPAPAEIGDLLEKELLPRKLVSKKEVITVRKFYNLMKMITHREVRHIEGREYDNYYQEAEEFVKIMEKIVKGNEGRLI